MSSVGTDVRAYRPAAALLACLSVMSAADAPRLNSIFNATTLAGWHPQGTAEWRVEESSIIGSVKKSDNVGGWLVLDHAYEDFILELSLRCTNCESAFAACSCDSGTRIRIVASVSTWPLAD